LNAIGVFPVLYCDPSFILTYVHFHLISW